MADMTGQVALVTGGTRSIGLAIRAVDCGCQVQGTGVPGGYHVSRLSLACLGEVGLGTLASTCCVHDRIWWGTIGSPLRLRHRGTSTCSASNLNEDRWRAGWPVHGCTGLGWHPHHTEPGFPG
jgi:hypothetical protein